MIENSFFLVRTNPALTGNVKLVVDSEYKLYLESFAINKALSQDRFKHFEIKKDEYYKEVIPYFFKDIESRNVFEVKYNNDASEMFDQYNFQFDDQYFSGAFFTEDVWYKEEYEYLAPLYLKPNKLPSNFIILRVDGAGSLTEDSKSSNFRSNIIDNWKYVTSFNLTTKTDLGSFLEKNFLKDEDLPKYPLVIKHGDIELSEVSGADIRFGGWATKHLNLHETQSKNIPIFRSEEFITKLWEENDIVYPHILNLKFLFDDTPATPNSLRKYSINRYIGFYADDMPSVKFVSPYEGIQLNKPYEGVNRAFSGVQNLSTIEVSEIPYLKDNKFVREINGRLYSFDPIKKGWDDSETYWVEWEGEFYRLERLVNEDKDFFKSDAIIGDYIYRVIATKTIECELVISKTSTTTNIKRKVNNEVIDEFDVTGTNVVDTQILNQMKKVLINELSTGKEKIKITSQVRFNNSIVNNLIENIYPTYTSLKRVYNWQTINNTAKFLFRLDVSSEIDNNRFSIPNYDEADLHLIKIENQYHVIKKYADSTPNVGGKYYIHTDWAININDKTITSWINNGIVSKNPIYYNNRDIQNIKSDDVPPFFEIVRVKFTDIKDFDFDRVDTNYANYEYEKNYELTPSLHVEPKLYAKEYRDISIKVRSLPGDKIRRVPILDINDRPYNVRDQIGEINPFTNQSYTDTELYRQEYDGNWTLFDGEVDGTRWYSYKTKDISVKRKYYREEHYIWRIDDDNNQTFEIDFKTNSDSLDLTEGVYWGETGKNEIGLKQGLPPIKAKRDPNKTYDPNYIPVSSEYIASDELWEIRNQDLTDIWRKNQSICKWGYLNSIGLHDYPYRLNYSLDMAGMYNREPNPFSGRDIPIRSHLDLDYFYRFGINDPTNYSFYSLHLKNVTLDDKSGFNVDRYISKDFDYFEYIFKSDQETSNGISLTKKYSTFISDNEFSDPYTVFRGLKYTIFDIEEIKKEPDPDDETNIIIDDIVTKVNTKYEDYKFTIIFGKKSSVFDFNPGKGNGNAGIDIYLNDIWKNVVIHLYIDSDETIQIIDENGQIHNAETCPIDLWYQDSVLKREINPTLWDRTEFKVNNFGIGIRPRDFTISQLLFIMNNFNYNPSDNKDEIKFIHIYNDGRDPKIMTYQDTDFYIKPDLPTEIITKENSYRTIPVSVDTNLLPINNTLKNRIILDDDPNNPNGNSEFTSDGFKVGILTDLSAYNEYPIAKQIVESIDTRNYWELTDETDPSMFRHSGPYVPIFTTIPLFRPLGYLSTSKQSKYPILESGNWKFYDPASHVDTPNVINFATLREVMFSKCNPSTNVLKIQDSNGRNKSIYPMVDEYGYEFDSRFLFASNWEPSFNYLSRKIEIEPNAYPDYAGYTILFDGEKDFLRIPDADKFNLERYLLDDVNYENFILNEPEGERSFFRKSFLNLEKGTVRTHEMKLLIKQKYKLTLDLFNYIGSGGDSLDYWVEVINDPSDPNQTGTRILTSGRISGLTSSLNYNINFWSDSYNTVLTNPSTSAPYEFRAGSGTLNIITTTSANGTPLERMFVYGNSVNVRFNFRFNGALLPTHKVDIFPMKLELVPYGVTNLDNFLDIDLYGTNGSSFIQFVNDIDTWGGYLRIDGTAGEIGEVHSFPFRIKGESNYENYSILETNLKNFVDPVTGKTISNLEARGFDVSADDILNRTNPIIRISHTEPFSFEPERWTNIEDGRSITYVGQKTGDSSIEPEHTLRWFTVYRREKKQILRKVIHRYETYHGRLRFRLPSIRRKKLFIPGIIRHIADAVPVYKPNPIETLFDRAKRGNLSSGIKTVVDFYNNNKNRGITRPNLPKFVQPIGRLVFGPGVRFLPVPLPRPSHLVLNVRESVPNLEEQLPETITFQIVPANGEPISVNVSSRHPVDGSALKITEVLGLINNIITPNYEAKIDYISLATNTVNGSTTIIPPVLQVTLTAGMLVEGPGIPNNTYIVSVNNSNNNVVISNPATLTASGSLINYFNTNLGKNYKDIKIVSRYAGSYYNFKINIQGSHISLLPNKSVVATEELTISEKYTKTSLKEGQKRITGFLNEYTVEFWIKTGTWEAEHETVFYKGEDTDSDPWLDDTFNNFTLIIGKDRDTAKLAFRTCHKKLNNQFEKHTLVSTSEINDDLWHHIACVVDTTSRRKSIYIDGKLDATVDNFLTPSYDIGLPEKEILALFLDFRKRILPGSDDNLAFPDFTSLASKIRTDATDNKTTYWMDVIRGYRELNYWDKQLQLKKLGTTIDEGFKKFQENFEEMDYYLNTSTNNSWHILIATDSTLTLGKRNFGGSIDELRIWNYARSSEQINSNYRFILRPESYLDPLKSLVAYYRFDEGKGVNTLKDLMGGKMISDLARWGKVRTQFINDGFNEREKDEINYLQFETSFYSGSDIQINLDDIEWIVSEADIIGFSDERYTAETPPPSDRTISNQIERPIFPKTEFMLNKLVKPRINIKTHILNVSRIPVGGLHYRSTWLSRFIGQSNVKNAINFINKVKIIEPKKIVASLAKAPSKWVAPLKKLFGKKKRR